MDDVDALPSFLTSERADVRCAAAEAAAAYSAHPEACIHLSRIEDALLPPLIHVLESADATASASAGAALVNMSQQPSTRVKLIQLDAVKAAVAGACGAAETAQMSCMLLVNLTQFDEGTARLLCAERIQTLLGLFSAASLEDGRFDHLPPVLTHMFAVAEGRALALARDDLVGALLLRLTRGGAQLEGAAHALRNLCFEAAAGAPARPALLKLIVELVPCLAAPLHVQRAAYTEEERSHFSQRLSALVEGANYAEDAKVRLALTEALLLLSASAEACAEMTRAGIYPVLRESHLAEESEEVREANEQLVAEFYLKGIEPPTEPPADYASKALESVVEMEGDTV